MTRIVLTSMAALAGAVLMMAHPAAAQSCNELWFQRNAIFAEAGYCFQTARARAVFGAGCFPPYGRLTPRQQARVNAIRAQEDYLGCPR